MKYLFIFLLLINMVNGATINGTTYKIDEVEYTINNNSYTQTTSGTAPTSISRSTPVYIKKVTLDNGIVLDNFATNNISVTLHQEYLDLPSYKRGVIFNGSKISATNAHAIQALNTTNIKDYVTNDDESHEKRVMDIEYTGYHLTGDDYIFFHERHGNNAFKVQALNESGNPIGHKLIFPATKNTANGWDPGFEIGGPIGAYQHPYMGVIKASQFGVEKIYGLRQWATGADLKFYAVGTENFTPIEIPCSTVNYSTSSNTWIEGTHATSYENNLNISKTIKMSNTTNLRVTVSGEIEEGNGANYDWIYVYDKDGNEIYKDDGELNNTPFIVSGNEVMIKLHSDGGVNGSGATIKIEGTSCSDKYDFGDAPTEYPHVSHKISNNLYLGNTKPDEENNQQSSSNASGDGADDNDGVIELPTLTIGATSYTVPVKVFNNTGNNAYITAWIDFNRNNQFEFNEALNVNDLTVPSSASSQTVDVVWNNNFSSEYFSSLTTGKNIMRIRLTTSRILRCDSEHYSDNGSYGNNYFISPDGEVEDYQITIQAPPPMEVPCGTVNYSTSSNSWIEGTTPVEYSNDLDISKTIQMNETNSLKITISGEIEHGHGADYDWIYVYDENGTQLYKDDGDLDNTPFIVSGNKVTFKLHSDGGATEIGATIKIEGVDCMECGEEGCGEDSTATCYAMTDNNSKVYKVLMNPNGNPLPIPTTLNISRTFNGEGSAYRASNHTLYAFQEGSNSDLYTINLNTGAVNKIKESLLDGSVEGAEFYYNPIEQKEILYITSEESHSKLYAFYADTWSPLNGYPKNIHGSTTSIDSLAINPITGSAYASDDYDYDGVSPKIHELNLKTGKTTLKVQLQGSIDAEGLAYASDGNLYVEDENYFNGNGRKIYKINLNTGVLTPSAILGGSDDVEGISCNGTQIAIDYPSITFSDSSVIEGNSSTTDLNFILTLSKPALEDITFDYNITDYNSTVTEDYIYDINRTITIPKDATTGIITIKIKGDREEEENEDFLLQLFNVKFAVLGTSSAIGTIINDDREIPVGEPFNCSQDSYLTTSNDLYSLNLTDGNNSILQENYTTDSINAIGYNVKDDFIWGWNLTKKQIVRIDANYTVELFETSVDTSEHDISDSAKNGFTSGDVSKDGILYLAKPSLDHKLHRFDLNSTQPVYLGSYDFNDSTIHFGDFAINPIDGYLYTTANKVLYRIDPSNANIDNLGLVQGDLTSSDSGYFHSYVFDKDGNMYFYSNSNGKKVFKLDLSDFNNPSTQAEEFTTLDWVSGSGDGARCANAEMPEKIKPIGCIASAFMFQNNHTDISTLNLTNGEMQLIQSEPISEDTINSQGFNKKDGFFWGYNQSKKNGTITKIGLNSTGKWSTKEFKIDGLEGFSSYVGDINSHGHLYLKQGGSSKRVVIIDLDPNSNTYLSQLPEIQLTQNLSTADWAFNPIDNMLYAVNNANSNNIKYLYKIDPNNGNILYKKDTNLAKRRGFGAGFFDANGFYYVYDNNSGEIFRIDVANSPNAVLFSIGGIVKKNDGAMCTDAEFKFDFGDLPENYPTLLESDGARHSLPTYGEPIIYMGSGVSHENNGKPSTNANLDSNDDGVKLNNGSLQGKTIDAGATTTLTINTQGDGYLSAWIDWNADGDFDDNLEKIVNNIDGSSGLITINVTAPNSAIDRTTYARFRYSSQEHLDAIGNAINGEVEDYKITIHGNLEPFVCSQKLYLSNRTELGTGSGDSGATWLHGFYAMTPIYSPIGNGFTSSDGGYNAIGYNIKDNFIYALYGNQLLKIDKNAHVKNLGAIEGLPNTQLYAGEFDRNGFYYVSGNGNADNKMYKINVTEKRVTQTITLSSSVRFWDMAIDLSGNYFYTMLIKDGDDDSNYNNDKFAKIDIRNGVITPIGESHKEEESYISLIFSDGKGKVIAIANEDGMYDINPQTGVSYRINTTPALSFYNDGTSCPDANFTLPPHIPRLSIGDVTKAEGDSGQTMFEFEVSIDADLPMMPMGMPTMFFYKILDGDNNDITINALDSDNDFRAGSGIGMNMNIFSNNRTQTISVPVYGDTKVEKDEKFYVEIYFPNFFPINFVMMGKDRGVGTILNDDMKFKVVRTNGDSDDDSLYTQITGRDFDYSMVSEKNINIDDMTLKIELVDNKNLSNHILLYTGYKYIEHGYRTDETNNSDLAILRATKDASFRVSFLKDENGTILHGNYADEENYSSIENRVGYTQVAQEASDNFAIRPAGYKVEIQDVDESHQVVDYRDSTYSQNDSLPLVAEYNYRIDAKAVALDVNNSTTIGYTQDINLTLKFDGKLSCNDTNNSQLNGYKFNNGQLGDTITHNNFGKYLVKITDNSWSDIDKSSNDCITESSIISDNGNEKSGCNISTESMDKYNEISIQFKPYMFDMSNTTLSNIHGNGKDYLYMSDLNLSQEMGVELKSTVIAKGKNGGQLTNFTESCIENNPTLTFKLRFGFEDDRGIWSDNNMTLPQSISGKTLNPQQVFTLNDDTNSSKFNKNIKDIVIEKKDFNNTNEGTLNINIFYNMEKLFRDPTNPIKVNFISLDLNTTDLEAKVEGEDEIPVGKGNMNQEKTFYFARVVSYVKDYPETDKKSIQTPLFVEIFCKTKESNQTWCREKMKLNTLGERIGAKTYRGWYLAKKHDSTTEGHVHRLLVQPPHDADIQVTPMTTIPPFIDGRIKNIRTSYRWGTTPIEAITAKIEINTDSWLTFTQEVGELNAIYSITLKPLSSTTGDGLAGKMLQSVQKTEHNGKMSW